MSHTFRDDSRSRFDAPFDALGRLGLLARVLTTGTDVQLFDAVLAQAVAAINATGGMLALLQHDGTLRVVADTGYPDGAVAAFGVFTLDDDLPASVAARTRQPVWVPNMEARLERFPELVTRNTGQVASASFPLEFEDEVLGVLGVSFATAHDFTADERTFLRAVADQSALLLRLRELSAIGRRADRLAQSGIVGVVSGKGDVILEANDGFLDLVGYDQSDLEPAGLNWRTITPRDQRSVDDKAIEQLLAGRRSLTFEKELRRKDGTRVPVLIAPALLSHDPFEWTSIVIDLSELRRAEAALTEGAEREQRMRGQQRELQEAQRIARLGSWYWDVATNEVTWSRELYRIYGLPEGTPVDPKVTLGSLSPNRDEALRLAGRATESREPVVFDQPVIHTDGGERITEVRMEADFDAASGRLRGMRGTTQDVTELRAAKRSLDAATERIERKRAAIKTLQQTIFPSELPRIEGVDVATRYIGATRQPAQVIAVGGDWFDVFSFNRGLVGLTIGDVVGHGLSSVEHMVQMRAALRMALVQSGEPNRAIDALESFTTQTLPGTFATAIACVFDPRTGNLTWTRAGHLPFVVCRRDGSVETPVHARRPPISTDARPSPVGQLTLAPGEGLLLYTDGLVERRGEAIDVGIGRLVARMVTTHVDPERMCDAAVVACLDGTEVVDDVCLLALARR